MNPLHTDLPLRAVSVEPDRSQWCCIEREGRSAPDWFPEEGWRISQKALKKQK